MILEWGTDFYLDGISYGFTQAQEPSTGVISDSGQFLLVYDPWTLVWVQYAGTAADVPALDSAFQLIYDGWTFIWVQYGTPQPVWQSDGKTSCTFLTPGPTSGSWRAEGTGAAQFTANEREVWFLAQGEGFSTWNAFSSVQSGFTADGKTSCNFYAASSVMRADGKSKASFSAIGVPVPVGFTAKATGKSQWMATLGQNEECLAPGTLPPLRFPNFVY